jgi:hypothetical protein
LACLPALPVVPAGKTVSHIKEVPGWSERLASDAEAVVKAERDVRHQLRRAALHCAVLRGSVLCGTVPLCSVLRPYGSRVQLNYPLCVIKPSAVPASSDMNT